jgi:excisionase family DNA binding protein
VTRDKSYINRPWYKPTSGEQISLSTDVSKSNDNRTIALEMHDPVRRSQTISAADVASPYLTTKEAARYLKLSHRTLERLRVLGTGPAYRRAGTGGKKAKVLYVIVELEQWMAKTYSSTSEYE